jgi:hypothetical protein
MYQANAMLDTPSLSYWRKKYIKKERKKEYKLRKLRI